MIKIDLMPEPADFDEKVRRPGLEFMAENPDAKPKDFWKACKDDLYEAYRGYCAYTTFRIVPRTDATVDHLIPKSIRRDLCYEWSNYRLCSPHANSVKKDATGLLDPVSLPEDAFFLREDGSIEGRVIRLEHILAELNAPHGFPFVLERFLPLTMHEQRLRSYLSSQREEDFHEGMVSYVRADARIFGNLLYPFPPGIALDNGNTPTPGNTG